MRRGDSDVYASHEISGTGSGLEQDLASGIISSKETSLSVVMDDCSKTGDSGEYQPSALHFMRIAVSLLSAPVTGPMIRKISAPSRHSLCSTVIIYGPDRRAGPSLFVITGASVGVLRRGTGVGGVRARIDS
jgi:hypothetical protein